jgi:hypothetical protein
MKIHRLLILITIAASILMITACGGGVGGDSIGYGDLAISVVDAKPLLPDGVTNFTVTFTEVLAHGKGGWESLPMPHTPYTIDLMQFLDDNITELVPPVSLVSGKYTQIRLVLDEDGANIGFDNGDSAPVVIPSENLKTDKDIIFNVPNGGSVDLVIDFDLSQSLVVTDDGTGKLSYICKPVVHISNYWEASTITGTIADDSFANFSTNTANITVFANGEIYTEVTVERDESNDVGFTIFWLAPNKDYRIEIDFDNVLESATNTPEWCEDVNGGDLPSGVNFLLNGEDGAITPPLVCPS